MSTSLNLSLAAADLRDAANLSPESTLAAFSQVLADRFISEDTAAAFLNEVTALAYAPVAVPTITLTVEVPGTPAEFGAAAVIMEALIPGAQVTNDDDYATDPIFSVLSDYTFEDFGSWGDLDDEDDDLDLEATPEADPVILTVTPQHDTPSLPSEGSRWSRIWRL